MLSFRQLKFNRQTVENVVCNVSLSPKAFPLPQTAVTKAIIRKYASFSLGHLIFLLVQQCPQPSRGKQPTKVSKEIHDFEVKEKESCLTPPLLRLLRRGRSFSPRTPTRPCRNRDGGCTARAQVATWPVRCNPTLCPL